MRFYITTLGCKANLADSESISEALAKSGMQRSENKDNASLIIVNTCAVTMESERKSRNMLRRMRADNPQAVIIACGCWSRVGENAQSVKEVDLIIKHNRPGDIAEQITAYLTENNYFQPQKEEAENRFGVYFETKTRAALKIQDGCNRYCTYCIIPYARGELFSEDIKKLTSDCRRLAAQGFKEVVLTGIHIASYSYEGHTLADVIDCLAETDIKRIRLGSLEPLLIDEAFAKGAAASGKLCPHFHLSLQSGSDSVLKRMNRHYTAERYSQSVDIIRKYFENASLTTDIIVGFPGETRAEFEESMALVEKVGFAHVHIFPYSPRRGTPAAKMPSQLTKAQKQGRVNEMEECCSAAADKFKRTMMGKRLEVLPEYMNEAGLYEGYTENYLRCEFPAKKDQTNIITPVKITDIREGVLLAEMID